MQNEILVTGASGNIGGKVAHELLKRNLRFAVTGRSAAKLKTFAGRCKLTAGDLGNEAFLEQVLQHRKVVFLVLPALNELLLEDFAGIFLEKARVLGVTHLVNLSSCILELNGIPTTHAKFERLLNNQQHLHVKHLRCANFFDNLNWGLHTPYNPDLVLPYVSSYEVAYVAASYLEAMNFTGCTYDELLGKNDYSMKGFAELLHQEYKQLEVSPENAYFYNAFNKGNYKLSQRTAKNTSVLTDEKFTLKYFLENDFNKNLLTG